jgi:hypothetical protein
VCENSCPMNTHSSLKTTKSPVTVPGHRSRCLSLSLDTSPQSSLPNSSHVVHAEAGGVLLLSACRSCSVFFSLSLHTHPLSLLSCTSTRKTNLHSVYCVLCCSESASWLFVLIFRSNSKNTKCSAQIGIFPLCATMWGFVVSLPRMLLPQYHTAYHTAATRFISHKLFSYDTDRRYNPTEACTQQVEHKQ